MKGRAKNRNLFDSILNIGVEEGASHDEIKQLRIVNGIAFIGGLVLVITSITLYFMFKPYDTLDLSLTYDFFFGSGDAKEFARHNFRIIFPVIDFFIGLICLAVLGFNTLKLNSLSKVTLCLTATLFSSFIFLAGGVKVVFIFFIPAILPIMFFRRKSVYFLLAVINFLILFIIAYILDEKGGLLYIPKENYFSVFVVNIIFAFTVILLIVNHFKIQSLENEKLLEEQNHSLKVLTNKISSQRNELKVKNYKLKVINATKDKFFSIIAHDLKNPFNGILGFAKLLIPAIKEGRKEDSLSHAKYILDSAKNAYTLLENLLEWSRSQTGRIKFTPKPIDLKSFLLGNGSICKSMADAKSIELEFDIPSNITILADENMLNTILRNLITNAIKYSNKGGKVSVSVKATDTQVEISVTDTGIGMSKETLHSLFKIHELSSKEGTENETGTGLGLLLCKTFTEKHGGEIWVESELEKGSCFIFSIPIPQKNNNSTYINEA